MYVVSDKVDKNIFDGSGARERNVYILYILLKR